MAEAVTPVWRVGAIVKEPLGEVLKFCAWYLELGAEEVVICFDDPNDPALDVLSENPRLRCIPCTPEFWADLGLKSQDAFVTRQNAALTWLYHQYSDGWLLNVDADEFVYFEGRSVSAVLASVPDGKKSLRVKTAERLLADTDDAFTRFRLPMERPVRRAVYREDAKLFGPRREGFVGHAHGKSFVRCGIAGLLLRQHWPRGLRSDGGQGMVLRHEDGAYLLHMIGADFGIWRDKVAWRSGSRGFTDGLTEQVEVARRSRDPEKALRDLHRRLHHASRDQLSRLEEFGALLTLEMNIDALVQEFFPMLAVDRRPTGRAREIQCAQQSRNSEGN